MVGSMSGGMYLSDAVLEALERDCFRFMIVGINNNSAGFVERARGFGQWEEFLRALPVEETPCAGTRVPLFEQAAYGLFLVENGGLFVLFIPECARIKTKILYSSTKSVVFKTFCARLSKRLGEDFERQEVAVDSRDDLEEFAKQKNLVLNVTPARHLWICAPLKTRRRMVVVMCANRFGDKKETLLARLPRDVVLHHLLPFVIFIR